MDYQTDFETWKEKIETYPEERVKTPHQPVEEFAAKAETLAIEAIKDKVELEKAGLDVSLIDNLPGQVGALRFCQANWMSEFQARQEAQERWLQEAPLATNFRDELLHHFSFAYRNTPDNKKKVMRIREGHSQSNMIQDLLELALLGEKNPDELSAIGFDLEQLNLAKTTSHNMAELLALSNGVKGEDGASKILRDRAYSLVFENASTIREYGRYLFWKNEKRRVKYLND